MTWKMAWLDVEQPLGIQSLLVHGAVFSRHMPLSLNEVVDMDNVSFFPVFPYDFARYFLCLSLRIDSETSPRM